MGWIHGQNERLSRDKTKIICDKQIRNLQKTRRTTAEMGDLRKAVEEEKWREMANNRER